MTTTSADSGKGADVTARADNGQESDKRQDGAVMLSSTARQSESVGASASTSTGPVPPSGRGASTGKGAEVCSPTSADVGIAKGNPATAAPDSLWPELKGAASPPAAPPPDEAVKAAPEEIDDDLESKMRCIENYSLDRNDERVAWRAALRAERERANDLGAERDQALAAFAAERASADARVRAVAEAARCALTHDGLVRMESGHWMPFKNWYYLHNPALAAELGAAGEATDHA